MKSVEPVAERPHQPIIERGGYEDECMCMYVKDMDGWM